MNVSMKFPRIGKDRFYLVIFVDVSSHISLIYLCFVLLFFFQPKPAVLEQMGTTQFERLKTEFSYKQWHLKKSNQVSTDQLRQISWPWVWSSRFQLGNSELKMTMVTRFATMQRQKEEYEKEIVATDPRELSLNKQSLFGITDTQIVFDYHLQRKARFLTDWFIGLGFSLPTGKNQLRPVDVELANQFYSEVLDFQISRLGEGFNRGISLFTTHRFSTLCIAVGGNYLVKGKYSVLPNQLYKPGNESHLQAATLWKGQLFSWRNNLGFRHYSHDSFGEQTWFQQGGEILGDTSLTLNFPRGQLFIGQHLINRLRNSQIDGDRFGLQIRNTNSNFRQSRLGGRYHISPLIQIELRYERLFILPNENKIGRASVRHTSFSVSAQFRDYLWANAGCSIGQGEMQALKSNANVTVISPATTSAPEDQIRLNGLSFWIGVRQNFELHKIN